MLAGALWGIPGCSGAGLGTVGSLRFVLCRVLKWQPWNTRLHLPLFVLWAAVAGSVLARSWSRTVTAGVAGLLLLLAIPDVFGNVIRPLTFAAIEQSRQDAYFNDRGALRAPYIDAVKLARSQQCGDIGMNLPMNAFQYPLLALLDDQMGTRKVRDVEIATTISRQYSGGRRQLATVCSDLHGLCGARASLESV